MLDRVGVGLVVWWEEPWGSVLVLLFPPKAVFRFEFSSDFSSPIFGRTVDR